MWKVSKAYDSRLHDSLALETLGILNLHFSRACDRIRHLPSRFVFIIRTHLSRSFLPDPSSNRVFKMRLTAELINNSLSYLNPLNERELDLRGTTHFHKKP